MIERPPKPMSNDPHKAGTQDEVSTLVPPAVQRDRVESHSIDDSRLDSLFESVAAQTIDRSPTWRDRLREQPTTTRIALAGGALLLPGVAMLALVGVRGDLDIGGVAHVGGVSLLMCGGALAAVVLALRPSWRSPVNVLGWVAAAAVVLVPFLLSVVPGLMPGATEPPHAIAHLMCGMGGLMVSAPAAAAVMLLQRADQVSSWRVLLAAGGAGLAAFAVSQLHCLLVDPVHLLISHAGQGLVVGLVVLCVQRLLWRSA